MSLRVRAEARRRDERGREFEILRVERRDVGLLAFLAIEAEGGGRPGFGGLRRAAYPHEDRARDEALALASGMALKLRCAELPAIGAKAVMMDHAGLDRPRAYEAFADFVAGLEGRYVCGPDLGTGEDALDLMRARTRHVNDRRNRPGLATARGVAAALGAALEGRGGRRVVLVEGLGSVGAALARRLVDAGHRVIGVDLDAERRQSLAAELGEAFTTDAGETAEVYAPCALGRGLDQEALARWRGRVVCGSANDQRAPGIGPAEIRRSEVLWVPDFLANPGAVVEGVLVSAGRRPDVPAALDAIGARTAEILAEARRRDLTPLEVALERAEGRP